MAPWAAGAGLELVDARVVPRRDRGGQRADSLRQGDGRRADRGSQDQGVGLQQPERDARRAAAGRRARAVRTFPSPPSPRRSFPRTRPSRRGRCASCARCSTRLAGSGHDMTAVSIHGARVDLGGRTIWRDVDPRRRRRASSSRSWDRTASGSRRCSRRFSASCRWPRARSACSAARPAWRTMRSATCRSGGASIRPCASAVSTSSGSGSTAIGSASRCRPAPAGASGRIGSRS